MKKFFLALLIFLPLTSFAGWIQTSPECEPKNDKTVDQTCPFCRRGAGNTSQKLHLEWQISNANFSKPFCLIQCSRTDGKTCSAVSRKDGGNVATSTFEKLPNYFDNYNLKPNDDVFIPDIPTWGIKEGNIYRAFCCQLADNPTILKPCKDNSGIYSGKMTVTGCGTLCEIPFSTISNNLRKNLPATITEVDFNGWAKTDDKDYVGWTQNGGPGSGDVEDIKAEMAYFQTCQNMPKIDTKDPAELYRLTQLVEPVVVESNLRSYLDRKIPVRIGAAVFIASGYLGNHAMVALSTSLKSDQEKTFDLKVLDSDISGSKAKIYTLSCVAGKPTRMTNYKYDLIECTTSEYAGWTFVLIRGNATSAYVECNENNRVRNDPPAWLEANFPKDLPNFAADDSWKTKQGVCGGWSDFVIRVACFGKFTNKDFNPIEGQYVGSSCDANHYPKSSSASASGWLANVWGSFKGLLPSAIDI